MIDTNERMTPEIECIVPLNLFTPQRQIITENCRGFNLTVSCKMTVLLGLDEAIWF